MLAALKSRLIWLGAGLIAFFGLLFSALRIGRRQGKASAELQSTKAALEVEQERIALDDEINADTDLAARARRSGLVRPGE